MPTEELQSCELGTQDYWDNRYKLEVENFQDHGDVGEIWFGDDIVQRIIRWMDKSPAIDKNSRIIDLGCGNGMLLIELAKSEYADLTGVDYSADAIVLAEAIRKKNDLNIKYAVNDILKNTLEKNYFDVALDKGTYDAISLSDNPQENRNLYVRNVADCLKDGGLLALTSCNWTKEELCEQLIADFDLFGTIPTPQFKFGGKVGNVVTSLVFKKKVDCSSPS